jgi:hypothetical protein
MKKNLVALLITVAMVSGSVFAEPALKPSQYSGDGNDLIIYGANHNLADAFEEGRNMGGSVTGAERKCLAAKAQYENTYGVGACEKIRNYAPGIHAAESFVQDLAQGILFWCVTVPVVATVSTVAVVVGVVAFKDACVYRKKAKAN